MIENMKKLVVIVALVLGGAGSVFGQGQVLFSTSVSLAAPPISAPVFLPGSTTDGPGPGFSAALYLVSGAERTLIESSLTTFRSGTQMARRFIVPKVAQVPDHPGGTSVTLIFRMWDMEAGSFEAARTGWVWGESVPFTVTLSSPPNAPADPQGIQGFSAVPEPSTLTLGVLGAAALLLRRRK